MHFRTVVVVLHLAFVFLSGLVLVGCSASDVGQSASDTFGAVKQAITARLSGNSPVDGGKKPKRGRGGAHLVEVAPVEVGVLEFQSTYTGSIRPQRTVRVHVQEEGEVALLLHREGDSVRQDELLLKVDDALLLAQLAKARAVLHESKTNLERLRGLRAKRLAREDEFVRTQTAVDVALAEEAVLKTRLGFTEVRAPFDGVVAKRFVEPGDVVARHAHVLTLYDPKSLVLDLAVSELLLPDITIGDPVEVRIDALGRGSLPGRISRVHPQLDARTRQGTVEVTMEAIPSRAQPGQFARVTFTIRASDRLYMPFAALRRDREGEFVFAIDDEKTATRVSVRSGRRLGDIVEIYDGIDSGRKVVLRGFLGLRSGQTVKFAKSRPTNRTNPGHS